MAFLRLMLLMLAVQSVVFVCVMLYLRAAQRERLSASWPHQATEREREAFVDRRVSAYMSRIKRPLALAVYGLPIVLLAIYIYVSNS